MKYSEFIRAYPVRMPSVMWLLGAGASAASGIPTADWMTWDFKRRIYCSEQHLPLSSCADLFHSATQTRIQSYCDSRGWPQRGSTEEYSFYFEEAFPQEGDRRRYIDELTSTAAPTYGHVALAALMATGKVSAVWTTNFDRLLEHAFAAMPEGGARIDVATTDSAHVARQALAEGKRPLVAKLHGDFSSRHLKNTSGELREQDEELRAALVDACRTRGLAVIGYSGRDESVMSTLRASLQQSGGFPGGLFWLHRADSPPGPTVCDFIEHAVAAGVDAHLVECETFDELFSDLLDQGAAVDPRLLQLAPSPAVRIDDAPLPGPGRGFPTIRLNALPVLAFPRAASLAICEIGGTADVKAAVSDSGKAVLAARIAAGVVAFGTDDDIQHIFKRSGSFQLEELTIEPHHLYRDGSIHGLLVECLALGIARSRPVRPLRRGRRWRLLAEPAESDTHTTALRKACNGLDGTIPKTRLRWCEAVSLGLAWAAGRPWLTFEPTLHIDSSDLSAVEREALSQFAKERLAKRYNRNTDAVIAAWARVLAGDAESAVVHALGLANGHDATFTISRITGYSRRLQ
ncbi:MAG: SIR2 family protein [Dehalococcoidia bacterium]|nr:SIR2 family protein [Dehalococcoidia bacterium]